MITYTGHVLISLLTNFKKRQLTFRGWIPYNYSSFMLFCLTYSHQYVGVILACLVSVACDSLIIGLLLYVCCQITILQYRLKSLTNGQNTLRDCVRQHRHIIELHFLYRFAYAINKRFARIIAFQFVASTFVICSNLYQLTRTKLIADFIAFFAYTLCILVQIFIYCWFGNKLKLMSLHLTNSIFQMEWPVVENSIKKDILIIMKRAMIPIEITTVHILIINLDSFVAVSVKIYFNAIKMHTLKLTFLIVVFVGCFRPLSWTSLFMRVIYNLYRLFIVTILYIFAFLQFMDIMINVDNPDDFTNILYMALNVSVSGFKLLIMWLNYNNVTTLITILNKEPFKPLDLSELKIRQKFDKIIRSNTLRYSVLIASSWTFMSLMSLLTDFKHRKLTYREWVPYDYSSYMMFCVTYAHQILSTFYCASVNVACDTLICGFLMHVYCQIEILEYRLKKILNDQNILDYCVRHHNSIFQFACSVNAKFSQIIGLQFIISTLIICSNLYQLSQSSLNADSIGLIGFTCCMLTEIFLYCWFGHKIKSKSVQVADSIFQIKWPLLNNNVKTNLLIIMKRATVPIEFTTAHIISLNLDSFWMLRNDVGKKSEMPVLKFTLTVLAVAGCWRPTSWTSLFRHMIYNAYTASMIITLYIFAMTQIMELILRADNADTIGDALFNALISLLACYKAIVIRINHDSITMLIDNLVEKPFKPVDLSENMIREKFDKRITNNTLYYLILVLITAIYMILLSIFTNFKNGTLMYRAWLPFDSSISALFYLAYAHQIFSLIFIGLIHPTCDNLICGLLLHICCQIEILEYRLSNIANDQENLRSCVRHHIYIFEKYAVWYYGLVQVTVICIILNAIFMDFMEGNLTYKAWVPFDYTLPIIFLLIFTHQMIGMSICAAVNVACDSLITGLLQEICCQFEILEYRLTKILHEKHILHDCVRHHNRIYEYARIVNHRFAKIIALQFAVSMLVVCANLYKLAAISLLMINGSLVTLILYTACMLSQIFLYCWFGNELKLRSTKVANSIYNIKWQELNNENKKSLLLIMRRSMIPIEFKSTVVITLNLDSAFTISQIMNIALNINNFDEISDNIYMTLAVFIATYKIVTMWIIKEHVVTIVNVLKEEPFKPSESCEIIIRQRYDKTIRNNMRKYLIIVLMSIASIVTMSVSTDFMKRNLTYKAWIPFDYSSPAIYFVVYIHQLIAMSTSGIVNVACESLLCGFLLHICCQFEILGYRLTKLPHDQNSLRDCVRHHNRIFEYAYTVNNMFAKIIAVQFAVSMLVVCSNLYRIAMARDYVSFIPLIMYTSAILVQIFIYCWFGNEVKLKSLQLMNNIYNIQWPSLSNSSKKGLLIVMRRAMNPIEFSSAYIITMNLESFVAVSIKDKYYC
ncbi:OR94B protein, partial [Acromyrmex charruanus]